MSLWGLWELSIGLTACSLFIMLGLVVARFISEHRSAARSARRSELLPLLLNGEIERHDLASSPARDKQVADLFVELITLVRGDEREKFVHLASRVGVERELVRRLRKGSSRERASAAEALSGFTDERSTRALESALGDRNSDVRLTAALALSLSGRAPPIRVLIDRLSLGQAENSLLLVTLLGRLIADQPHEVEALLDDRDVPPRVKAAAMDAIAASGRFHVAPSINSLALATDAESEELARYLRALGVLRHPAGIPAVRKHLRAETWWVRAAAAEAAGRIGVRDAIPELAGLLDDEDWWVRFRAGEALAALGEDGRAQLRALSRDPGERARSAARMTLAELGLSPHG